LSYNKKKYLAEGQIPDWVPWTTACFPSREARDLFLLSVESDTETGWNAEPSPDDDRGAAVRWRSGRFLRLNDMAYAHGGRIIVTPAHRRS